MRAYCEMMSTRKWVELFTNAKFLLTDITWCYVWSNSNPKNINHIIFNMNLRDVSASFYIYVFPHHLCHICFHNVDSVDHGWLYFLPQSWQYLLPLGWLPFGADFVPVSPPQSPCSARETNNLLQVNLFHQNLK